jgi:hypothetical protein
MTTSVAKAITGTLEGKDEPYNFSTPERLTADFLADVCRLRGVVSKRVKVHVLVSAA